MPARNLTPPEAYAPATVCPRLFSLNPRLLPLEMRTLRVALCAFALVAAPTLSAQVIDLTIHDVGVAIGDKPRMTGLRLNYRDKHLERITGANVTLWGPYSPPTGTVTGLALGLPSTGADHIKGIAAGILGVGVGTSITGIGVGG